MTLTFRPSALIPKARPPAALRHAGNPLADRIVDLALVHSRPMTYVTERGRSR